MLILRLQAGEQVFTKCRSRIDGCAASLRVSLGEEPRRLDELNVVQRDRACAGVLSARGGRRSSRRGFRISNEAAGRPFQKVYCCAYRSRRCRAWSRVLLPIIATLPHAVGMYGLRSARRARHQDPLAARA